MKIRIRKIYNRICWFFGFLIIVLIYFITFGKVNLVEPKPQQKKGKTKTRSKNEKIDVDINDIGTSNFDL